MAESSSNPVKAATRRLGTLVAATLLVSASVAPAMAGWAAGRGTDETGLHYLSVYNTGTGSARAEFDCTPAGQAFFAVSWPANPDLHVLNGSAGHPLHLTIDGSHRFGMRTKLRSVDSTWMVAEIEAPDGIGALTATLSAAKKDLAIRFSNGGVVHLEAVFDVDGVSEAMARYRSYCRMN